MILLHKDMHTVFKKNPVLFCWKVWFQEATNNKGIRLYLAFPINSYYFLGIKSHGDSLKLTKCFMEFRNYNKI